MFIGFNLSLKDDFKTFSSFKYDYSSASLDYVAKDSIEEQLTTLFSESEIDATQLEKDWFPNIDAHVFLSHSHMDQELAICLANWLYDKFRIKAFVDSCFWGYANNLLKQLDNKYCILDNNTHPPIYNYNKRNISTAHVHILLNMALQKMIDKTECLIFLNTPNSVNQEDITNESTTSSCWIYNEILFSKMARTNIPKRHQRRFVNDSMVKTASAEQLRFKYILPLKHLIPINYQDLMMLERSNNKMLERTAEDYLDLLYKHKRCISN